MHCEDDTERSRQPRSPRKDCFLVRGSVSGDVLKSLPGHVHRNLGFPLLPHLSDARKGMRRFLVFFACVNRICVVSMSTLFFHRLFYVARGDASVEQQVEEIVSLCRRIGRAAFCTHYQFRCSYFRGDVFFHDP